MNTRIKLTAVMAAVAGAVAVSLALAPGLRAAGPDRVAMGGPNVAVQVVAQPDMDIEVMEAPEPAPVVVAPANPGALRIRRGLALAPKVAAATDAPDEMKDLPAGLKADIVTTVRGDRVTGTVVGIEAGGKLRLKGPQFESEVVVSTASVDGVILAGSEKEAGGDEILLTNGDRLFGTLKAVSPDAVIVDTPAAGQLKISPKVIRSIGIGRSEDMLLDSAFFTGRPDPWVVRGAGMWEVKDGMLVCSNRGSAMVPLYAKLDQKEAVTMVAKVQSVDANNLRCDMVIFSDGIDGGADMGRYGRNSLFAMFTTNESYLQVTGNSSTTHVGNHNFGRMVMGGVLRLAYDPASGKARMWLDNADLGEYVVPNKPTAGQYVMFNSVFPIKVEYLKVLRGIVPPAGEDDTVAAAPAAPADENVSVLFANKDRVSALKVSLAEGQMVLTTSYGEIKCLPKQIARIVFGKKSSELPIRGKGDVRVRTGACRLTLELDRLTGDALIGHSDVYGGEIKLRRASVQEIKFNIYK